MSKATKQHYVPQFYLKRFEEDGHLWVFDKSTKESFRTSSRNIACETGFYNIAIDGEETCKDGGGVEKAFSKLENMIQNTLDTVLRTNVIRTGTEKSILENNDKLILTGFIYTQSLRTLEARNIQTDIVKNIYGTFKDIHAEAESRLGTDIKYPEELDDINVPLSQVQIISNSEYFVKAYTIFVREYIWNIAINNTKQPFYTSDHPVVRYKKSTGIPYFAEIALPLTPNHLLLLSHKLSPEKLECPDDTAIPISHKNVEHFNSLQVFQCNHHIYCPLKKFNLARQIRNKYPEWCKSNRPRLTEPTVYKNIENVPDNKVLDDNIILSFFHTHPNEHFLPPHLALKDSPGKWELRKKLRDGELHFVKPTLPEDRDDQ